VLGVVSAPQLQRAGGRRRATGLDRPLAAQGDPCQVSDVRRLEDASLSYSSLSRVGRARAARRLPLVMRRCWRTPAYGDFWSYMLLAEGAVDIAAEPDLEVYDMAALDVIVREAGGRFTSLDGTDGPFGGKALASNGHLHEAALSFLGSLPTTRTTPTRSRGAPARCTSCGDGGQIHRPGGETHAGVEKFHDISMSFSTSACPGVRSVVRLARRSVRRPLRGSSVGPSGTHGGAAMRIGDLLRNKPSHDVITIRSGGECPRADCAAGRAQRGRTDRERRRHVGRRHRQRA
jgi:hypothetical protein